MTKPSICPTCEDAEFLISWSTPTHEITARLGLTGKGLVRHLRGHRRGDLAYAIDRYLPRTPALNIAPEVKAAPVTGQWLNPPLDGLTDMGECPGGDTGGDADVAVAA